MSGSSNTRASSADQDAEQLRALGGQLKAKPGESVLRDEDFEALR